jgi:excisionase family DNA binding protein
MSQKVKACDVAVKLGVTSRTVLNWARRGIIPCLRAGARTILFDLAEVERALKERTGGGQEAAHVG